ncbi:hypothetical protein PGB90_010428 [Kerria lacca]
MGKWLRGLDLSPDEVDGDRTDVFVPENLYGTCKREDMISSLKSKNDDLFFSDEHTKVISIPKAYVSEVEKNFEVPL